MRNREVDVRISWLVGICLAASTARGDLLYFAKGGRAELPSKVEGKVRKVTGPDGMLVFEPTDFTAVVARPTVEEEWPERKAKADRGTPDDRFAAAWWALENGLTPEASALIRKVADEDPNHKTAARLRKCLDELDREIPAPNLTAIRAAVGSGAKTLTGKHVLLMYEGSEDRAKRRLDVVERVLATYLLTSLARGVEVHPPRARLVSLWYADKGPYVAFLQRADASAFVNTQGYYHPTLNLVAGFDHGATPAVVATRREVQEKLASLERYEGVIRAIPKGARTKIALQGDRPRTLTKAQAETLLSAERRDLARVELLLSLEERAIDQGLTAHETLHQLLRNTGFAGNEKLLPSWLDEGLATQYEVVRGGRWAGVGRVNDQRVQDWRSQSPEPRLAPLLREEGFGRGYNRDLYARCWALIYYLSLRRPTEFTTFLDAVRNGKEGPAHLESSRFVTLFARTFGEIPQAEADWRRFLKDLKTPLEEFDPNRKSKVDRR